MHSRTLVFAATSAVVAAAAQATPAAAQRTWPEPGPPPLFAVDVGKGVYTPLATPDGMLRFGARTFTFTGSAWLPLSSRLALTAELPVSHVDHHIGASRFGATILGDPWLGLEAIVSRDLTWELGIRPGFTGPTDVQSDTLARSNGIAADYDHYEAWRPGYRALRSTMHLDHGVTDRLFIGGLAGASVAWSTGPEEVAWSTGAAQEEEEEERPDLYLLYGVRLGYRDEFLTTSVAFLGRAYPTAHGPFTERTVHQFAIDAGTTSGSVRPTLALRIYRDRFLQPRTTAVVSLGVRVWR